MVLVEASSLDKVWTRVMCTEKERMKELAMEQVCKTKD